MVDREQPLQILMPTDVFPPVAGGAGWSAHALALALQERGHSVTAIVPQAYRGDPTSQRRSVVSSAMEDVLGVPTIRVPYYAPRIPFVANWYRHEWLWPLMRNVLVRQRTGTGPAIIHAQHVQSIPGAVLAGDELDVPVVATVRDHWPWDYHATGLHGDLVPYRTNTASSLVTDMLARQGPLKGLLAAAAIPYMLGHLRRRQQYLGRADAVIAVSRYIASRLPDTVQPDRVSVVPNIVDVAAIDQVVAHEPPASIDGPFVLFVGKLERNKGAHLLPTIMDELRRALPDPVPQLVIAGEGVLAASLHERLTALAIPFTILPGWTDHDEVLRLMHAASVVLFPSLWGDALSRVLLEASATGACIVAMPTGGTPEAIEDGKTGVLASNAEGLGCAAAALLSDPERSAQLRRAARDRAHALWTPQVVATQVERVYRKALTRRASGNK